MTTGLPRLWALLVAIARTVFGVDYAPIRIGRGFVRGLGILRTVWLLGALAWTPPIAAGQSEIEGLAEQAIAVANRVAEQLLDRPNDPFLRAQYENALHNIWLAREAVEEEYRLGNLDARSRARMLARLAGLLGRERPRRSLSDAIGFSMEEESGERFVPSAMPIPEAEALVEPVVKKTPDNPPILGSVRGTGAQPPPATSFSENSFEDPNGRGTTVKAAVTSGYNAPSRAANTRPLSGVLDFASDLEPRGTPLRELLASALKQKSRPFSLRANSVALAPALGALAAGLSGKREPASLIFSEETERIPLQPSAASTSPVPRAFFSWSAAMIALIFVVVLLARFASPGRRASTKRNSPF